MLAEYAPGLLSARGEKFFFQKKLVSLKKDFFEKNFFHLWRRRLNVRA